MAADAISGADTFYNDGGQWASNKDNMNTLNIGAHKRQKLSLRHDAVSHDGMTGILPTPELRRLVASMVD